MSRKEYYAEKVKEFKKKGETIEEILRDVFETLHYSERPYEELKEKASKFMVRTKMIIANREGSKVRRQEKSILRPYLAEERVTQVKRFLSLKNANNFMLDGEVLDVKFHKVKGSVYTFVIYKTNFEGYPKE